MFTNTLAPFMPHKIHSLVSSGESNVTPADVITGGKVVIVDLPPLVWHLTGQLVQAVWKVCVQREVLRRSGAGNPRPVFVFADEAHLHALPDHDVVVQTVARESRLINVNIVQNLQVLTHAFGGHDRRAAVEAWCSNLAVKFACANSDNDTNRYYADLFGYERKMYFSGNVDQSGYDVVSDVLGIGGVKASGSFSEQRQYAVEPSVFSGGRLRTGGVENGRMVDCYVHLAGRRFSNGKAYSKVSFRQEG